MTPDHSPIPPHRTTVSGIEGMEETTEGRGPQATLVATSFVTSFVTTVAAYFKPIDRLRELDEPTPDEPGALRAASAGLDDLVGYLALDFFPSEDESAALRLGELAELVDDGNSD